MSSEGSSSISSDRQKAQQMMESRRQQQQHQQQPPSNVFSSSHKPLTSTSSSNNNNNFDVTALQRQVAALEHELSDTKRMLLDAVCDKKEVEADKKDLQATVEELRRQVADQQQQLLAQQQQQHGGGQRGRPRTPQSSSSLQPTTPPPDIPLDEGDVGSGSGGGGANISDRARRTMMHMRMERNELRKEHVLETMRHFASSFSSKVAGLRQCHETLKRDTLDQLHRGKELAEAASNVMQQLTKSIDSMQKRQQKQLQQAAAAAAARRSSLTTSSGADGGTMTMLEFGSSEDNVAAGGSGGGAFGDLMAMQQRNVVLSQDHPVIQRSKKLFDGVDRLCLKLNTQWAQLRCFEQGRAPYLEKTRRFMDPVVNLSNYEETVSVAECYVSHAAVIGQLYNEMRLPQSQRHCDATMREIYDKYTVKLAALYDSMKLLRAPVASRARTLHNAFKMLVATEAISPRAQKLAAKYQQLSMRHTGVCFKHVGNIARAAKVFALFAPSNKALTADGGSGGQEEEQAQQQQQQQAEGEATANEISLATVVGTCQECGLPALCEDCHAISRVQGVQRWKLVKRRELSRNFTAKRIAHFGALLSLMEEVRALLVDAKLLPMSMNVGSKRKPLQEMDPREIFFPKGPILTSDFYFEEKRKQHNLQETARQQQQHPAAASSSSAAITVAQQELSAIATHLELNNADAVKRDLAIIERLTPRKPSTARGPLRSCGAGDDGLGFSLSVSRGGTTGGSWRMGTAPQTARSGENATGGVPALPAILPGQMVGGYRASTAESDHSTRVRQSRGHQKRQEENAHPFRPDEVHVQRVPEASTQKGKRGHF